MSAADKLADKHFLILRPKAASELLLRHLTEGGAKVSHFPMFEIKPWNSKSMKEMTDTLDEAHKAIFVSPSAVEFFFRRLAELGLELPEGTQCFAPGVSTASVLKAKVKGEVRYPKDVGDATSLLTMPEFSGIEGQRVDIIGGESGSHQIIFELLRRSANASYVSCYRPEPSEPVGDEILAAHEARPFSATVAHSNMALGGLVDMLGDDLGKLTEVPVITHHQTIWLFAKRKGFKRVLLARNGKAEAIVEIVEKEL